MKIKRNLKHQYNKQGCRKLNRVGQQSNTKNMKNEKLKIEHLTCDTGDSLLKDLVNDNVVLDKIELMMEEEEFGFAPDEKLVDAHVFNDNEVTFTRTGFVLMPIGNTKVPLFEIRKNGVLISINYILPAGYVDGKKEAIAPRKYHDYPCLLTELFPTTKEYWGLIPYLADFEFCIASFILQRFESEFI